MADPAAHPLYRWMRKHHDALAAAFVETPPAWGPLAAEMAAVGLTDADGKPPTAVAARQTWYRVRRDLARAREQQKKNAPVLAPDEIAPAVHAVTTPAEGEPSHAAQAPRATLASGPRMSLDIRPVRAASAGASPAPGAGGGSPPETPRQALASSAEESPAEQVHRLLTAMQGSRHRTGRIARFAARRENIIRRRSQAARWTCGAAA